jgi:CheY-like chemotaxis protein
VAHDFNNLLTVILGEVTLLRREPEATLPSLQPSIANIEAAAERATHLTRQLLTFARRQLVELVPLNLNEVLQDLHSMVDRLLGEDVTFTARLADDLGLTLADRGQLEQVLVNLVVNARDAMPHGGTVTIETQNVEIDEAVAAGRPALAVGPAIRLSIADTGTGLTADAKAHLFEPFFTTKEQGKGTGLGLATCYAIVRQHNGHIELFSEAGVGTTVHVYLPRVARSDRRHSPRGRAAVGGDETILYVEDDHSVRAIAVRLLRALGYTVLEAADGQAALALLAAYEHPVHLLLTDVVMPQMGGRALADHVRATRPDVHILFASGYSDDEILNRQLLDRDVVLLQKPFSLEALAAKVREALTRA